MRKLVIITVLLAAIYVVVTSDAFNASFNENFYAPIFTAPFDVSTKGNRIQIPLHYKYRTEYGFSICIPFKADYQNDILRNMDGEHSFTFLDKGQVVRSEVISPSKLIYLLVNNGKHQGIVYTFNLPLYWWGGADSLIVEVVSPIMKLDSYRGKVTCMVNPSYIL